ncbi:MAG: hypothetical protein GEV11_19665, partial [Streptosporangiales bacterium]|nr:hypothetical protein [Streptosporangiales bacterium]
MPARGDGARAEHGGDPAPGGDRGRRSALAATLGNEVGLLVWAVAAAFGITALIAASELAYDALRIGGGIVLIVLGIQSLRRARRITPATHPTATDTPATGAAAAYAPATDPAVTCTAATDATVSDTAGTG